MCLLACKRFAQKRHSFQAYLQLLFTSVFQLNPDSLIQVFNQDQSQSKLEEQIEAELELVSSLLHPDNSAHNIVSANPFKKSEKVSRLQQLLLALSVIFDKLNNTIDGASQSQVQGSTIVYNRAKNREIFQLLLATIFKNRK